MLSRCVWKNAPNKILYGIVVITHRQEINKRRDSTRKFAALV